MWKISKHKCPVCEIIKEVSSENFLDCRAGVCKICFREITKEMDKWVAEKTNSSPKEK